MNEEIKEILHELDCHGVLNSRQDRDLLNYITNLQEENQKLKKLCDKYEEEHNSAFKLWTMKMEKMPDYEERMKLKQGNQKLNKIIDELEKWLNEEIIVNKTNQIEDPNYPEWYIKWNCYLNILNKLTELKKR